MTVVHNAKLSDGRSLLAQFSGDGVCLGAHAHSGAIVVVAAGELDASNIHHLTECARRCLSDDRPLVLDFSQVDFFAAQGIRRLFGIADECNRRGIQWALVPGHAVTRLLRICDSDARLPVVSSIDDAVQGFSAPTRARGLLQLVTKSG